MDEHRHLPDSNRLSVLAATILLAYAMIPFIKIPTQNLIVQLPGVLFVFQVTFSTIISGVVAAMAAVGTDWLLQGHPQLEQQRTLPHWMIPALTALVLGVPLSTLQVGLEWWAVFGLGGVLLILVLIAEYIVVDGSDLRHVPATIGLTAVSFALYLILAIAVRAAGLRLYLLLLALVPAVAMVVVRTLYLRLGGKWCLGWAAAIAIVVGQASLGLFYWPLTPLRYGLILLGLAYALTSLAGAIEENRPARTLWVEPAAMLALFWLLALVIQG